MRWMIAGLLAVSLSLGVVQAQTTMDDCIDFTPATCPTATKNKFLECVDEFNTFHNLDPGVGAKAALWEMLRSDCRRLLVAKEKRAQQLARDNALLLQSDAVDDDLPTVVPRCGDDTVNQTREECDGTEDTACPGECRDNCTCQPPPPPTTTTTTTIP